MLLDHAIVLHGGHIERQGDRFIFSDGAVKHLFGYGLFLREIRPARCFDDDLVEVDAYFTRRIPKSDMTGTLKKLRFIEEVLDLKNYDYGAELVGPYLRHHEKAN
ncbi:hypothetical protein SAMN05216360_105136 [Methylobacterium phyllostachyos]|uniref:Uncharacterized protein n=1 Tax=Methylobacterium phyllostachyos TaxID=582672 RepID=A0A1G9Y3P7_9HYPH|nr:hypothetical protein [Methylobacterium phyllostachyos]SDN03103.1 hypothetical protein SAMN05216360_105136 [Methylobacterium phyllostachyos]